KAPRRCTRKRCDCGIRSSTGKRCRACGSGYEAPRAGFPRRARTRSGLETVQRAAPVTPQLDLDEGIDDLFGEVGAIPAPTSPRREGRGPYRCTTVRSSGLIDEVTSGRRLSRKNLGVSGMHIL